MDEKKIQERTWERNDGKWTKQRERQHECEIRDCAQRESVNRLKVNSETFQLEMSQIQIDMAIIKIMVSFVTPHNNNNNEQRRMTSYLANWIDRIKANIATLVRGVVCAFSIFKATTNISFDDANMPLHTAKYMEIWIDDYNNE